MNRRDKIVHREAVDSILLCNKLCRASRKRLKRTASKVLRQDIRQRRKDD